MSPTTAAVVVGLVTAAGGIGAAALAYLASRRANKTSARLTERADAVNELDLLVKALRSEFNELKEDHEELKVKCVETDAHVEELTNARRRDQQVIQAQADYISILIRVLRAANQEVPAPPEGLGSIQ